MELSEVYSKQVKKTSVTNLSIGGNFPQIEKYATIRNLTANVFAKMGEIVMEDEKKHASPTPPPPNFINPQSLSFEEALKELVNLKKSL